MMKNISQQTHRNKSLAASEAASRAAAKSAPKAAKHRGDEALLSPVLLSLGVLMIALPLVFFVSLTVLFPLVLIAGLTLVWVLYTGVSLIERPLPMPIKALAMIAALGSSILSASAESGQWMIVAFIFAFSLKLFELNARRDVYFTLIAALMLVGVVLLNFTNMASGIYLFVAAIVLLVLFRHQYTSELKRQLAIQASGSHETRSDTQLPITHSVLAQTKQVALWVLMSVPLTVLLFYTIPRMDPMGFLPQIQAQSSIGLSDHLSLDNILSLQKTGEIAFRVTFEDGVVPNVEQLYWRVLTMEQFDGNRWDDVDVGLPDALAQQELRDFRAWKAQNQAQPVMRYEVMMEPDERNWLPSLMVPERLSDNVALQEDWRIVRRDARDKKRFRYRMAQYAGYRPYQSLSRDTLRPFLYFPRDNNPRLTDYGYQLFQRYEDPKQRVARIKSLISQQAIEYSLSPAPLPREHVLDAFIYETREGYCEHFASSMAFLLRAAGVPSRIVTGFAGGEWNSVGEYLIVRQDEAHAWVEYWIDGEGWQMFDPTTLASSIASPRPQEQFSDMQRQLNDGAGHRSRFTSASWTLNLDAMNYQWYLWVVNYDKDKQSDFWQQVRHWNWLAIGAWLGGLACVLFALLWLRRYWRNRPDGLLREEWQRFEQHFSQLAEPRATGETPHRYCLRLAEALPHAATEILQFKEAWMLQMYHDDATIDANHLRTLTQLRKQACRVKSQTSRHVKNQA